MSVWLKKNRWDKIFIAAILYTAIAMLARQAEAILTLDYYKMPEYFGVWSKLMMPNAGPPPAGFLGISILLTFIGGLVLAIFYNYIKTLLPDKLIKRAFSYTEIVAVIMLVLSYFPMYMMFHLPFALLVYWFITGVIIVFLSSIVFIKLLK
ncbi:MAG: hypothetical protein M1524_00755 [Patescibacteria group bacterium]|nr:hypothetical protein [Patescibacteria group bacterium]